VTAVNLLADRGQDLSGTISRRNQIITGTAATLAVLAGAAGAYGLTASTSTGQRLLRHPAATGANCADSLGRPRLPHHRGLPHPGRWHGCDARQQDKRRAAKLTEA